MAHATTFAELADRLAAGEDDISTHISNNEAIRVLRQHLPSVRTGQRLRVISFNLGFHVQTNKLEGTEKAFVARCQKQPGGNAIQKSGFSACSTRALTWIRDSTPDLVGLQEINTAKTKEMANFFENKLKFVFYESVGFLYNETLLGSPREISTGLKVGGYHRYFYAVWFKKVKMVAIVVHAGHNIRLQKLLQETIDKAFQGFTEAPDYIVLTGDFNDPAQKLQSVSVLGHDVKQAGIPPLTCCYPDFNGTGDYVLYWSRANSKSLYYGTPFEASIYNSVLMSDHHPVLADIFFEHA